MLENPDGQPIAGAPIYVYSGSPLPAGGLTGFVATDGAGHFTYNARAFHNRIIRFVYPGAALIRPTESQVRVAVPAATSLRASRRRVRNGQSVRFRGRMRTLPVPMGGKLVEMQAHFRGRWRTFSTVHTDARGRWRFRYRFGATVGTVRYRFRALLPREGGYPFAAGRSRVVRVTVHG
jgi:hypothetical protein